MSRIIPDPVATPQELPPNVDVVIIGGGIVGTSTALFLAERGVSVALCEKGLIGAEQSSRNWGWVRQMGRDPAELPLAIESLRLWREMRQRVGAETGFRQAGIAYLCDTDADVAMHEDWLRHARPLGLDARLVTGEEMKGLMPGIARPFRAALHTASDGRAEPTMAAPAIARAAAARGAHILVNCAVRTVELAAGRVGGVVTERGEIRCSTVVLAGGAWSRLFAGNLGLDFPALKVLGSVGRLSPVDGVPDMAVGAGNFSFRRRLDGGFSVARRNATIAPITSDSFRLFADFTPNLIRSWREMRLRIGGQFVRDWKMPRRWNGDTITPFEQVRILDPDPAGHFVRDGVDYLAEAFPAFRNAKLTHMWAGLIDVTPDAVPVIGPVGSIPGFYFSTGFSGHGFGIGPGAGALMADLITGQTPCVDPAPFRMERFRRLKKAA